MPYPLPSLLQPPVQYNIISAYCSGSFRISNPESNGWEGCLPSNIKASRASFSWRRKSSLRSLSSGVCAELDLETDSVAGLEATFLTRMELLAQAHGPTADDNMVKFAPYLNFSLSASISTGQDLSIPLTKFLWSRSVHQANVESSIKLIRLKPLT